MRLFRRALAVLGAMMLLGVSGNAWAVVVSPATIPDPQIGVFYSQTFTASGGLAPFTFSSGVLPAGLTLTGATISGVPTATGAFTISVQASDSNFITVCIPGTCPPSPPTIIPLPQSGTQTYNVNIASNVPTLSEWAMILLALMLAGGAAHHLWRRQAYQAA